MTLSRWIIVVAAIVAVSVATGLPALADTTDPVQLIYRASGVTDDGSGSGAGVATAVHCTNASDVDETLVVLVRGPNGALKGSATIPFPSANTVTAVTHGTMPFSSIANLTTGAVAQGYVAIGSTTTSMFCTALVIDAANPKPVGVPLHMLRYNPIGFTLE